MGVAGGEGEGLEEGGVDLEVGVVASEGGVEVDQPNQSIVQKLLMLNLTSIER